MRSLLLLVIAAGVARAQTIKGAVLAKNEPHHHLAYEDEVLRVLRVHVAPHDTTLLHEHGPDYIWIALGASTIVNAKLGAPDTTISSKDLTIHYTPGMFAHVARNLTTRPFDNITVELLQPQTNPVDRLRASLVTIDPGKTFTLTVGGRPAWVIALDTADLTRSLTMSGNASWTGGTVRAGSGTWSLSNHGTAPVRAMVITALATRAQ